MATEEKLNIVPDLVAFEGRVYRLDRISVTRSGDVEVARVRTPTVMGEVVETARQMADHERRFGRSGIVYDALAEQVEKLEALLREAVAEDGGLYDLGLRAGRARAEDAETDECIAKADALEARIRERLQP